MRCTGKVAIVTGAAGSGMGRSIALTLAREGASVAVNYRTSEESAQAIVAHIKARGGSAVAIKADIFHPEGCRHVVDAAVEQFDHVDICIIGPGAGWHPDPPDKLDSAAALEDLHAEVAPIHYLMPLLLPGMYERKWGRVIAIALSPPYDSPAYAYNAAKAARTHALLLARDDAWGNSVTLNIIGPGPVAAIASLQEAIEHCDHGPAWQNRANITPQDIAEAVAFLCSEDAAFITGCVLPLSFR